MKPANRAPFYASLYPGLCDIARKHGYALAIHGSMLTDLDLLACPWTDETPEPEAMVQEMKEHLGALYYPELLRRHVDEQNVQGILKHQNYAGEPKAKPHGRRAWSLHLDCGAFIDLSVMPRLKDDFERLSLTPDEHARVKEMVGTLARIPDVSKEVPGIDTLAAPVDGIDI